MFPHLNGWRANIEKYQEIANKELLSLLEKCDGNIVSEPFNVFGYPKNIQLNCVCIIC